MNDVLGVDWMCAGKSRYDILKAIVLKFGVERESECNCSERCVLYLLVDAMWISSPKDWRPDDLIHTQPFWIAKGETGLLLRIALFQTSHLMLMLTAPSSAYFLMHKRVAKPDVTAGCAAHRYRKKPNMKAKSLGEFHFYKHYTRF